MNEVKPIDVAGVVSADPWRMAVLRAVRSEGLPDWAIGAGFVRNAVWDSLHGHIEGTRLDDVDVLYFDRSDTSKRTERDIEARLDRRMPSVPWSVRNQARMHLRNGDEPYTGTADALRYWLETATCVAVTLDADERISVIAPYGLEDLLAMRSRPTARGRDRYDDYLDRMRNKNWSACWPRVRVEGL